MSLWSSRPGSLTRRDNLDRPVVLISSGIEDLPYGMSIFMVSTDTMLKGTSRSFDFSDLELFV